jgi:ferredoxin
MGAADELVNLIEAFVGDSPDNRHPDGSGPLFDSPLVGFAAADDPLFQRYREIIGPFHRTPREVLAEVFGRQVPASGTVVVWVLPITRETRVSNRGETTFPSRPWALTRQQGEGFNSLLRRRVVAHLGDGGHLAAAPLLTPGWRTLTDPRVGLASTWSERHAAYAAGLGTFSLNDALITPRGIAHRLGSVVTDLVIPPTPRPHPDRGHHCLFLRRGSCGVCIRRCPVGAITTEGHDKERCRRHVYGTVVEAVGQRYGVAEAGCGLCQTAVPCEERIPRDGEG